MRRLTRYASLFLFAGALFFGVTDVSANMRTYCGELCDGNLNGNGGCPEPSQLMTMCVAGCIQEICGPGYNICHEVAAEEFAEWCVP